MNLLVKGLWMVMHIQRMVGEVMYYEENLRVPRVTLPVMVEQYDTASSRVEKEV